MIKVLGKQRIIILSVFAVLNIILALSIYLYLQPESQSLEQLLRTVRNENQVKQSDITRMQVDMDQLDEQREDYKNLQKEGFFFNQSRELAQDLLLEIKEKSGVSKAVVSIAPGYVEPNEEAEKAEYKILLSGIKVDVEAFDDIDIYKYIFLIEEFFPGHITLDKFGLRRSMDLNLDVLGSIESGEDPAVVVGSLEFSWRTMLPRTEIQKILSQTESDESETP